MIHEFDDIRNMPTVHNNTHESIYRSYHILRLVVEMLQRGDSAETILQVISYLDIKQGLTPEEISVAHGAGLKALRDTMPGE